MNELELQCRIGDKIYVVEDFNNFHGKTDYYTTKYNSKIIIRKYTIRGFIIDEDGVHIAEDTWDGWIRYAEGGLTLEKYSDRKIFNSEEDAIEFVKSVAEYPEEVYGVNLEINNK